MSALAAGQLSHFPLPPKLAKSRPAYAGDFAGKCKVFPAPDAKGVCPFFLGYQADWIRDGSRLKLEEKARQIGISWSTAYRGVVETSAVGARYDSWVSSRDEIQAGLFLQDSKQFAGILNAAAEDLGEKVIDDKGHSARVLRFANGRAINSMSSNADAQAGKRGSRLLDEFALHPDPRVLYSIAYPGITWGGSLEIVSTHRGSQNFFNELLTEAREKGNPKGWSLHRVTLQTALEHGFLYKLQCKLPPEDRRMQMDEAEYFDFIKSGCADEESFLQEYMCVPGDDASAFLSYELIAGCRYPLPAGWAEFRIDRIAYDSRGNELRGTGLGTWTADKATAPLYIGWDIGRMRDLTVIAIGERLGSRMHIRQIIEMERTPFERQEAELHPWLRHKLFRRAVGDQTGIGRQFAERAARVAGKMRVEGLDFTPAVKDELATPMRAAFEDRNILVPDDALITADLRGIRRMVTATNQIRFDGERGKNGHCDRFWALAMCLHAGKTNSAQMSATGSNIGGRRGDAFGRRAMQPISGGRLAGV